jgi:hypothetical protein
MSVIDIGPDQRWKLKKNGSIYFVSDLGKLKFNGVWYPSVSYYNCEEYSDTLYTRTIDDFLAKFERID